MDTYKIVNATQLDAGLASIADALRKKHDNEDKEYEFPQGYVDSINDRLYYDDEVNDEDDLTVSGATVTAGIGYYSTPISKSVPNAVMKTAPTSTTAVTSGAINFNSSTGIISVPETTIKNVDVAIETTTDGYVSNGTTTKTNIKIAAPTNVSIPIGTASGITLKQDATTKKYSITFTAPGYYSGTLDSISLSS